MLMSSSTFLKKVITKEQIIAILRYEKSSMSHINQNRLANVSLAFLQAALHNI